MNRVPTLLVGLTALALVGALASGCTTTSAGEPRPQDTNGNETDIAPTSGELPPRPRDIRVDELDPCALLPEPDYSDYDIEESGRPEETTEGERQCFWSSAKDDHYGFTLRTSRGTETLIDGSEHFQGEISEPILDFAAVSFTLFEDETTCYLSVDVADGQQLIAQASLVSGQLEANCESAHQFATSAMSDLVES